MAKKIKPTSTQKFYLGAVPIDKFVQKELALEKDDDVKKEKLTYYQAFQNYIKQMSLFGKTKEKKEPPVINRDDLTKLLIASNAIKPEMFDGKTFKWQNEAGAKAIGKYASLLVKNDRTTMDYYQRRIGKMTNPVTLSKILNAPTPETNLVYTNTVKRMAEQLKKLDEKLDRTEGGWHVNSSEYKAMRKALKNVNRCFANGASATDLGSCFEALQAASMNYVNAKGVGTQSTQRGIDRMDAVLDIDDLATEGMLCFTSNDRRKEIQEYEEKNFGQVFTKSFRDDPIEPVREVYKEEPAPEM